MAWSSKEGRQDLATITTGRVARHVLEEHAPFWAEPSEHSIEKFVSWAPHGAIEPDAINPKWAAALRDVGLDVLAYHARPYSGLPFASTEYERDPSLVRPGPISVVADHPERALFACWSPHIAEMLRLYTGDSLIMVGALPCTPMTSSSRRSIGSRAVG